MKRELERQSKDLLAFIFIVRNKTYSKKIGIKNYIRTLIDNVWEIVYKFVSNTILDAYEFK